MFSLKGGQAESKRRGNVWRICPGIRLAAFGFRAAGRSLQGRTRALLLDRNCSDASDLRHLIHWRSINREAKARMNPTEREVN